MVSALFLWTVLGALVGGFAKSVFWYESSQGSLACVLLGVVGGIAAGSLRGAANAFDLASMGLSVFGAALLLAVYTMIARRKQQTGIAARRAA